MIWTCPTPKLRSDSGYFWWTKIVEVGLWKRYKLVLNWPLTEEHSERSWTLCHDSCKSGSRSTDQPGTETYKLLLLCPALSNFNMTLFCIRACAFSCLFPQLLHVASWENENFVEVLLSCLVFIRPFGYWAGNSGNKASSL